ncbi:hypothetical protein L873DRAFT_939720 [Choiromyces venosus 120613-1]|uniref:Uncharacterized protein n=1 Tax=Choiromyces venosus 120613-1 TaxID=1336337 RepID=A0A3N4K3W0_9PEZI|nr:hypothetical protein L873DRAFT_939720 [Choiromyces venosus 120613-1]
MLISLVVPVIVIFLFLFLFYLQLSVSQGSQGDFCSSYVMEDSINIRYMAGCVIPIVWRWEGRTDRGRKGCLFFFFFLFISNPTHKHRTGQQHKVIL